MITRPWWSFRAVGGHHQGLPRDPFRQTRLITRRFYYPIPSHPIPLVIDLIIYPPTPLLFRQTRLFTRRLVPHHSAPLNHVPFLLDLCLASQLTHYPYVNRYCSYYFRCLLHVWQHRRGQRNRRQDGCHRINTHHFSRKSTRNVAWIFTTFLGLFRERSINHNHLPLVYVVYEGYSISYIM